MWGLTTETLAVRRDPAESKGPQSPPHSEVWELSSTWLCLWALQPDAFFLHLPRGSLTDFGAVTVAILDVLAVSL